MSGRGYGGQGRGQYFKEKYGGGGRGGRGSGRGGGRGGYGQQQNGNDWGNGSGGAGGGGGGSLQDLAQACHRIDGNSYKAYNELLGRWRLDGFDLHVDRIQADPFAPPSLLRAEIPAASAQLPRELVKGHTRRTAVADFLARSFKAAIRQAGADRKAGGGGWAGEKGGEMGVDAGGQHVLERTAVLINQQGDVEARFTVGLPARGRTVLGRWAAEILTQSLPGCVSRGLLHRSLDASALTRHVHTVEDTEALRAALPALGLVAFVGDGAILPRRSGASDEPLPAGQAVPFRSPPSLQVEVTVPHAGTVSGMGIGPGVTLIVGGGFHGKSTLLKALEVGYTNKVPGDGRELVVTLPDAVKIRAEDGRRVEGVDISPFISNLPLGKDTREFRTDDASGSTSQAANIMEALELGTRLLLIDEDTTATNFMIRDARMQALIAPDKEPITPLVARISALCAADTSCILVIGGSGDYFSAASRVIAMDAFEPHDVTARAHEIVSNGGSSPPPSPAPAAFGHTPQRVPLQISEAPSGGRGGEPKIAAADVETLRFGDETIDLSAVEQLVDSSQTRAIGQALVQLLTRIGQGRTLSQLLTALDEEIDAKGLDALSPWKLMGVLARPRRHEIAAAFNRLRTVRVRQVER